VSQGQVVSIVSLAVGVGGLILAVWAIRKDERWLAIGATLVVMIAVGGLCFAYFRSASSEPTTATQDSGTAPARLPEKPPDTDFDEVVVEQWRAANEAFNARENQKALTLISSVIDIFQRHEVGIGRVNNLEQGSYMLRAAINLRLEHYEDALRDCNEVEALGNAGASRSRKILPFMRYVERYSVVLIVSLECAICKEFISRSPNDPSGYQNLAVCYCMHGRYSDCLNVATQGLEINPQNPSLLQSRMDAREALSNSVRHQSQAGRAVSQRSIPSSK